MPGAGPKPRVLIVDSHVHNLELLTRQLQRQGYTEVATATDAEQALALLPEVRPDVILLDLRLPPVAGHSLLHHLRCSTRWADLPALVLVGRHARGEIPAVSREGVSGFIHQPFNGAEITYKIEHVVRDSPERNAELVDLLEPELLQPDGEGAASTPPGRT